MIGVPGGVGAFLGAVVLSNLSLDAARPWVSLVLLALGGVILLRFIHGRRVAAARGGGPRNGSAADRLRHPDRSVAGRSSRSGLVGGFLDASGGGGWGPVTTSTLMAASRMQPRKIIGTVSGSEFIVSIAASAGFLLALGSAGIDPGIVAMMLLGGAIAAPLSAWLVSRMNEQVAGHRASAALIIFLNVDRALSLFGVDPSIGLVLRLSSSWPRSSSCRWLYVRNRNRRGSRRRDRRPPDAPWRLPTLAA